MDANNAVQVHTKVALPIGTVHLVRYDFRGPVAGTFEASPNVWLEYGLTRRSTNARACFTTSWPKQRYEPIGDAYLVPPGETMAARSDGGCVQQAVLCLLHFHRMGPWLDVAPQWSKPLSPAMLDLPKGNLAALLLHIGRALQSPHSPPHSQIELLTTELAVEVCKYGAGLKAEARAGAMTPWRLRLIDARVRDSPSPPTLEELATLCNLSVRQLARSFKASRGFSIGTFIANCRIEHAQYLLTTDRGIKAIAHELGFSSSSSFSYAFRTATGLTPREFRCRGKR